MSLFPDKNTNRRVDDLISEQVRSVRPKVPSLLEERVREALQDAERQQRLPVTRGWRSHWLPLSAVAVLLLTIGFFLFRLYFRRAAVQESPVSEIKTEFVLAEQNIKILWYQKKNFDPRILEGAGDERRR